MIPKFASWFAPAIRSLSLTRSFPIGRTLAALALIAFAPYVRASLYIAITTTSDILQPLQYATGSSVKLSVSDPLTPTGNFQWLHDEQPIPGATANSFTLTNLTAQDSGNYRLRVVSGSNTEFSDNTVTLNVVTPPPSAIDPTFTADILPGTSINSIFRDPSDGSLVIAFYAFESGHHRAIRLRADGSRDPSLDLSVDTNTILAVLPGGDLITASAPYRLHPDGSAYPIVLPTGFDLTKPLDTAAVQPDGNFLIAQKGQLVRLKADGSVDPTFVANPLGDSINSLHFDSAGRIIVYASQYDQKNFVIHGLLDRLVPTGPLDPTFHSFDNYREWYYPSPLAGGGLLLEYYWSNYEGPIFVRLKDDGTPVTGWSTNSYNETDAGLIVDPTRPDTIWSRDLRRFQLTDTGLSYDPTFYAGIVGALDLVLPDGKLLVTRTVNNLEGSWSQQLVRLRTTDVVRSIPPAAFVLSEASPLKGSTFTLTSSVSGTGPFNYQWLALDGQPLPADTSSPQMTLPNFSAANLGRYQVRVTGPGGVTVLSNVAQATLSRQPSYLTNLSGRAMIGTGEDTAIAGLTTQITAGALGLPALLRGAGPALKPFGVTNFLPNPAIDLFNSAGLLMANNDQWSVNPDVTTASTAAGAFSFTQGSNDAALLHTFPTGQATVVLKNQGDGSGVGLLEIYQLLPTGYEYGYQSLTNLSFRARTSAGEGTAMAGFVIVDPQGFDRPAKVLLRAIGPTLGSYGIQHPLTNPILTVYNAKGDVVASNDDWAVANSSGDAATLTAAMKQVGAFDLTADSKDSALLLNLPAGAYSMQASGGSGVVLLEIYLVR